MAYSVNWTTQLITVPQTDLTLVSAGIYDLDMALFHKEIRRLEWEFDEGLPYVDAIDYVSAITFSGITLAPVLTVINGYTVEFENGAYAVNFAGMNSNLADVTVVNNVSIRPQNSAGLQIVTSGSGVTAQDKIDIAEETWTHATADSLNTNVDFIKAIEGGRWDIINNQMIFYDSDNTTEVARFNLFKANGTPTMDAPFERVRV